MELLHLQGNTYAVETDSCHIGAYIFNDQRCLLIDSGPTPRQGEALLKLLAGRGWTVHAIFNTHAHADHSGGNHHIQIQTDCRIFASAIEAAFIQQPLLIPFSMYGAFPLRLLQGKFFMPAASRVTDIANTGHLPINGQDFEILDLRGHSLGHMGIRTPDNVLFAGDSLIAPEMLAANPFLYLADPEQQLLTLDRLAAEDKPLLYLSHGGLRDDIGTVVNANRAMLIHVLAVLQDILSEPHSLEELIQAITARQGLPTNRNHYFRLAGSVSSFLSYLCNQGQAKVYAERGRLLYRI